MTMTVAEIAFGNGDFAMKTIPELHPSLTTSGVRADEFIAMFNPIGNDKVGSLEIVIYRHASCTTGDNYGTMR
jgi:hypothetical protein